MKFKAMLALSICVPTLFAAPAAGQAQQVDPLPPSPVRIFSIRKEGRALYVIGRDFYYCVDRTGEVIRIPSGFLTDFASIPFPASLVLRPDGPYAQAAIVHDYMYAVGRRGGRDHADRVLLAAMEDYEVPSPLRTLVYQSVDKGGAKGYALPGDWQFYDLNTLAPTAAQAKPPSPVLLVLPEKNCTNFERRVREWRRVPLTVVAAPSP
jgi:hypothetical protein